MKVCIISDLYYPYPGGISEHVHHTALELKRLGHEVKILTTNYSKKFDFCDSSTVLQNTTVVRVGKAIPCSINKSIGVIPIGFNLSGKIQGFLNTRTNGNITSNFDVIHLHTPNAYLPLFTIKHSKSLNIATYHSNAPKLKWHTYAARITRSYIDKVDGAIAVSDTALDAIERFIDFPHTIIPNGIDTERFSPEVEPFSKFKNGGPNILFVGRFEQRKGLKYLLQAFREVRKKMPTARLIIVGSKNRSQQKTTNQKGIYFEGRVSPENVPRYYASCDIYCSPAIGGESFGIVLLEAMSSGKPVIASNIFGYREVITDGEDGILVEPKNPDALAQKLIEILANKELTTRLGKNGRKTALKYSWEKVTKRIESFYYEIAEKKNIKFQD